VRRALPARGPGARPDRSGPAAAECMPACRLLELMSSPVSNRYVPGLSAGKPTNMSPDYMPRQKNAAPRHFTP